MLNDENRLTSENNDKLLRLFYPADTMNRKLFYTVFLETTLSQFYSYGAVCFLAA